MAEHTRGLSATGRSYITTGIGLVSACLVVAGAAAPDFTDRNIRLGLPVVSTAQTTLLASERPLTAGLLTGDAAVGPRPDTFPELSKWLEAGFAEWPAPDVGPGVMAALQERLALLQAEFETKQGLVQEFLQTFEEKQRFLQEKFATLPDQLPNFLEALKDGFGLRALLPGVGALADESATSPALANGLTGISFFDDLLPLADLFDKADNLFNTQTGTFPALVKWVEDGFPLGPDLHPGVQSLLEQALSIAPGSYEELMTSQQGGFDPNRYTVPQALALAEKILALEPGSLNQVLTILEDGFEEQPNLLPAILEKMQTGLAVHPDALERLGAILEAGFTILPGGPEMLLEQLASRDFYHNLALSIAINTVLGSPYQGVATVVAAACDLVFGPNSIPSQIVGGFANRGVNGIVVGVVLIPSDAISGTESIPSEFMRAYNLGGFRGLIGRFLVTELELYNAALDHTAPAAAFALGEAVESIAQQLLTPQENPPTTDGSGSSPVNPATNAAHSTVGLHTNEDEASRPIRPDAPGAPAPATRQVGARTAAGDGDSTAQPGRTTTTTARDRDTSAQPGRRRTAASAGNRDTTEDVGDSTPTTTAGTQSGTGADAAGGESNAPNAVQGAAGESGDASPGADTADNARQSSE